MCDYLQYEFLSRLNKWNDFKSDTDSYPKTPGIWAA